MCVEKLNAPVPPSGVQHFSAATEQQDGIKLLPDVGPRLVNAQDDHPTAPSQASQGVNHAFRVGAIQTACRLAVAGHATVSGIRGTVHSTVQPTSSSTRIAGSSINAAAMLPASVYVYAARLNAPYTAPTDVPDSPLLTTRQATNEGVSYLGGGNVLQLKLAQQVVHPCVAVSGSKR